MDGQHDYDKLLSVGADPPPHPGYAPAPHPHAHPHQHPHHPHYPPPHPGYVVHAPVHAPPPHSTYVVHAPPPVPHYAAPALPPAPVHHMTAPHHPPPHHPLQHAAPHCPPTRHAGERGEPRDFPIGFTAFGVPPGPPVEIEVKPQVLFQGTRLAVADSIAKDFVIVDIKVGTSAQLAATGEMSAEAFSALAVDVKMEFDPASPGTTITLRVRNIGEGPSNFLAVLYGRVWS